MKKSTTLFDFFKRKVSHDLEANTSGVTLPTTNVEKNPNVLIEENLNVTIEENLDVPFEENSQTKFQKVDMILCNYNVILDRVGKHILNHVDQRDEIRQRYIKLSPYRPFKKKKFNLKGSSRFLV